MNGIDNVFFEICKLTFGIEGSILFFALTEAYLPHFKSVYTARKFRKLLTGKYIAITSREDKSSRWDLYLVRSVESTCYAEYVIVNLISGHGKLVPVRVPEWSCANLIGGSPGYSQMDRNDANMWVLIHREGTNRWVP